MRAAAVVAIAIAVAVLASPANARIGRDDNVFKELMVEDYTLTIHLYDEQHRPIVPIEGFYQLKVKQGAALVVVEYDGQLHKQIRPRPQDLRFSGGQWMSVGGPKALVLIPVAAGKFNLTVVSARSGAQATIRIMVQPQEVRP